MYRSKAMIYIWGLGFFYKINEYKLKEFEIDGYIDNKKALEVSEYKGKPLIKSTEINSDMTVISGHQRLKVLKDLGNTEIECIIVNFDKSKEK